MALDPSGDFGTVGVYDPGDTFLEIFHDDFDLHVVPAGGTIANAIASSTSAEMTLEHIFAPIPTAGSYEIWVECVDGCGPYALAWWGVSMTTPPPISGDLNGDLLINFGDLTPFVWALTDHATYAANFPGLDRVELCDVSGDDLATSAI